MIKKNIFTQILEAKNYMRWINLNKRAKARVKMMQNCICIKVMSVNVFKSSNYPRHNNLMQESRERDTQTHTHTIYIGVLFAEVEDI